MGNCRNSFRSIYAIQATIFSLFCLILSPASAGGPLEAGELLGRVNAAYAPVEDYQTKVEVRIFENNGSEKTEKFLYTFKKPNRIRLDFEKPHPGWVLVYPDENGKVVVQPAGMIRIFKFHLSPDDSFLVESSGQRIDQTDLGLLIRHISHSLTDQRRGPAEITEKNGVIRIRVLADNPFRKGVVTLYEFFINKGLWLPTRVEESTPDGHVQRIVTFENLRINLKVPDGFFQLD